MGNDKLVSLISNRCPGIIEKSPRGVEIKGQGAVDRCAINRASFELLRRNGEQINESLPIYLPKGAINVSSDRDLASMGFFAHPYRRASTTDQSFSCGSLHLPRNTSPSSGVFSTYKIISRRDSLEMGELCCLEFYASSPRLPRNTRH